MKIVAACSIIISIKNKKQCKWVITVDKTTRNVKFIVKAVLYFAALAVLLPAAGAFFRGQTAAQTEGRQAETEADVFETAEVPQKAKREYQPGFDRLRETYKNDDIIGIIKIPGTVVYYPVAHHIENNEYYLERNLYKNKNSAGSICLDFENRAERHDPNTVLYGHQMSSNSMFHTLSYYSDKNFFDDHRYVIFNTIYENNVWEVFAFFKTDVSFNYIKVFFKSERDFLNLASEMKSRSLYDSGLEVGEGDRILTLSTCTNQERDTRYVLVARMIKNKSDIPEDIAKQMEEAVEYFK